LRPRSVVDRTITASFSSSHMPSTNDLSILISWIGSRRNVDSDEYPVPKSSMETITPKSRSASSTGATRSGSAMI